MIIPDVNLLLYASNSSSAAFAPASKWWRDVLHGAETVGLAWSVLLAYVRIATNPRVMQNPLSVQDAFADIDAWLSAPPARVITPGPDHLQHLLRLLGMFGSGGSLVPDAHLAALALEHGGTVHSADTDFSRWPVAWLNPLTHSGA